MNEQDYLMHYGVKGMKWGVRRYQNPDGTRTALGRQHEAELKGRSGSSIGERARSTASKVKSALTSDTAKKVYAGVAVAATVAAAAYLYSKNRGAVNSAVKRLSTSAVSTVTKSSAASKGKAYVKNAMNAAKGAASKVGSAAKKAGRSAGINAAATADIVRNKAKAAGSALKNSQAARSAYGAAQKVGSVTKRAAKSTASNIRETARAAKQNYDMNLKGTGKQAVKNAASAAKRAASKASVSARAAVDNARTNISNMNTRRAMDNAARAQGSVGSFNPRKAAFDNGVKSALNTAKGTASKLGTAASKAGSATKNAATKAGKAVSSAAQRASYNIKNARNGVTQVSKNAVERDRRRQQTRKIMNKYRSMNR